MAEAIGRMIGQKYLVEDYQTREQNKARQHASDYSVTFISRVGWVLVHRKHWRPPMIIVNSGKSYEVPTHVAPSELYDKGFPSTGDGPFGRRQARTNVMVPGRLATAGHDWNHCCQSSVGLDGQSVENNWRRTAASVFSRHPAANGLGSH
jgi:hypothetical protein